MIIQNQEFMDGELVIYEDYTRSEHAGAGGCFQIVNICIEGDTDLSILDKLQIDQGRHYHNVKELLDELNVDSKLISYKEKTV